MRLKATTISAAILIIGLAATTVLAEKAEPNRATREKGRIIYERACVFCHGNQGKGDGPAAWFIGRYSSPRPRDFTSEGFKLRSTESGMLPTDQDLFRTVTKGIPGYMPSFAGLSETNRWQVIAYIKSFNPAFKNDKPEPVMMDDPPLSSSNESIEKGRKLYQVLGCANCHGVDGNGLGKVSLEGKLTDAQGLQIRASDLSDQGAFKNGATARDIYRTIMTGLDGTPMPSYLSQFEGKGKEDKDGWHLVNYILSLSKERRP
jgi:mono/diheme cytochrome c family protein